MNFVRLTTGQPGSSLEARQHIAPGVSFYAASIPTHERAPAAIEGRAWKTRQLNYKYVSPSPQDMGTDRRNQRRRERGRISQRAFRVRQTAVLRDLREENARLKRVIKNMVEISQSGDRLSLISAINKVAEAAGLNSEISHWSTSGTGSGSLAQSDITRTADDVSIESTLALMPSEVQQREALPINDAVSVIPDDFGPQQSSCMTFRLNCGLFAFPISVGRVFDPPLDIAPYLGPNQQTLAAQIYWYCTETSVSLIYQLAGKQPSRIASVAQSHPVFAVMLRRVSTFCSYNYILALAEARLEFYRVGYCQADNLAAARDSGILLRQRVEQTHGYDIAGQDPEEWSTATTLARVVEQRLQDRELRRLEAAIRDDGTDVFARSVFEAFAHNFWIQSTCFGDGPRWKASYIHEQSEWLAQALSCNNPSTAGVV